MHRDLLANREAELALFDRMLAGQARERILLLQGGGSLGKTSLLAEFVRRCPAAICALPVDLKGSPGLHDVLACLVAALSADHSPALAASVARLSGSPAQAHLPTNSYDLAALADLLRDAFDLPGLRRFCTYHPPFDSVLHDILPDASQEQVIEAVVGYSRRHVLLPQLLQAVGQVNPAMAHRHRARVCGSLPAGPGLGPAEIEAALAAADDAARATRRAALTRALFEDLAAHPGRLILVFDTFERAGPEVQAWLAGPCLAGVARLPHLLAIIAGRQVPQASVEWQAACEQRWLQPVEDVDAWEQYARRRGWIVPRPWIEGFCAAARGNPGQMETMLLSAASYRGAR